MGWPHEAFLYLRQITTPKSRPQPGGNLLYAKSDNTLYLMDADGTEHAVGGSGGGTVNSVVAGSQISVDSTDPANPVVATTGLVASVTAGTGVTVDNTDPKNPVVSASGGGASTAFQNADKATLTADNTAASIVLNRVPIAGSEHAYWRGVALETADWSRTDYVLTVPAQAYFKSGDTFWVDYAYDSSAARLGPVITSPTAGSTTANATPTFTGTGAEGRSLSVRIDGASIGSTVIPAGGSWSYTPSSALATGAHSAVARQTEPDGTLLDSSAVSFTVPTPSYLDVMNSLSPLWYGRLNESAGTTMTDSSGNARNGSYGSGYTLGHAGIIPSMTDTCVDWLATSPALTTASAPYGSWMNVGTIGLVAWINPDGTGTVFSRDNTVNGRCWQLYVGTYAQLVFWTTTGGPFTVSGSTALTPGTTYMLAAAYDGTTAKVYVNGVLDGSLAQSGTLQTTATTGLAVGDALNGSGGNPANPFDGRIQGPAMFTSLTATNISDLWTAGQ